MLYEYAIVRKKPTEFDAEIVKETTLILANNKENARHQAILLLSAQDPDCNEDTIGQYEVFVRPFA